jgi:hypothetical protein
MHGSIPDYLHQMIRCTSLQLQPAGTALAAGAATLVQYLYAGQAFTSHTRNACIPPNRTFFAATRCTGWVDSRRLVNYQMVI